MRVVVVGAAGNAGTAILKALKDSPSIEDITGVARRPPDTTVEPYAGYRGETIDIAAASPRGDAIAQATDAFAGADAVIHLAWLIRPNNRRELLHRVNVEGTAREVEATAAAGVRQLVVASSVGAYSRDPTRGQSEKPHLRDEAWPATGIPSSHYSVDKAEQEGVLDDFAAAHPGDTVTQMRPALIFQRHAASEIHRYFLEGLLPDKALPRAPLLLPLPRGLQVQAVHADDLGRAYVAAVLSRVPGSFNVCADDVLGPSELGDIVDHGHYRELSPRVVRAAAAAYSAGVVAADSGWVNMALQVPLMDNTRAARELGWQPKHSAAGALRELMEGLRTGAGASSPPLRPREPTPDVPAGGWVPETVSADLLRLYLSDHLSGAAAGVGRIDRMAEDFMDTPIFPTLSTLAEEIRTERSFLEELIDSLGLDRMPYRQSVADAAEKVGRLKGNGRALQRSPMTLLLETEMMRSAVIGKKGAWQTVRQHSSLLGLPSSTFDRLTSRIDSQLEALDAVHTYARGRALRSDREIYTDTPD